MKTIKPPALLRILACCLATLVLASCSGGDGGGEYFQLNGEPKVQNPDYVRDYPPVALSGYTGTNEETYSDEERSAVIDLTNLAKGYVTAAVICGPKAKFEVRSGGQTCFYDLDNTGVYEVFPLPYGNGAYTFVVYINVEGDNYENFLTSEASVQLESEFAPYLVPNQIINYNAGSSAVQLAQQLTPHCETNLEVVQQVYYWVQQNIVYDTDKAEFVQTGVPYLPNLEQVLRDQKGICYDYAALVAAMLRSSGIPCKLIKGYVMSEGQDLYHAWNMIWLEETGWVAVKMPSTPEEWQRIDLTFAASGDPSMVQFIGDGQNYTEMYVH